MDMPRLAAFAFTALLIELTPGPNMGYLAAIAARDGVKAGLTAVLGVAVGLALLVTAAIVGVGATILADKTAFKIVGWSGVAYMFWLAFDAWRADEGGAAIANHRDRLLGTTSRGLITNLLNVKAGLFLVTVLPTFIDPSVSSSHHQAFLLGIIYLAIATAVHTGIVLVAALANTSGTAVPSAQMAARFHAGVLLMLALWLAYTTATDAPQAVPIALPTGT